MILPHIDEHTQVADGDGTGGDQGDVGGVADDEADDSVKANFWAEDVQDVNDGDVEVGPAHEADSHGKGMLPTPPVHPPWAKGEQHYRAYKREGDFEETQRGSSSNGRWQEAWGSDGRGDQD